MKVKIKYDKHGNVKKIIGNVGQTRMNLAALELWKGNISPTTGYKLRRFFKRAVNELTARAEAASCYHNACTRQAAEYSYIGIEEHCSR